MENEHPLDGTEKALPHVVTALIAKRAEIAGQLEHLLGQVKRLTVDLDHVEETLRLFAQLSKWWKKATRWLNAKDFWKSQRVG